MVARLSWWARRPRARSGGDSIRPVDDDESNAFFWTVNDFTTPSTLALADAAAGPAGLALQAPPATTTTPTAWKGRGGEEAAAPGRGGGSGAGAARVLRSLPPFFDASGVAVSQGFATSKDGTQVPYFLVRSRRASAGVAVGDTRPQELQVTSSSSAASAAAADAADPAPGPTLLYGYGGFRISLTPGYAATIGAGWLEKGGTYVVANIRGGGEFGPAWHAAALKEKRHKVKREGGQCELEMRMAPWTLRVARLTVYVTQQLPPHLIDVWLCPPVCAFTKLASFRPPPHPSCCSSS